MAPNRDNLKRVSHSAMNLDKLQETVQDGLPPYSTYGLHSDCLLCKSLEPGRPICFPGEMNLHQIATTS